MSFDFKVLDSEKVDGVKIVTPSVAKDYRGTIWTSFLKEELNDLLPDNLSFIHDKFSESEYYTLLVWKNSIKSA